MARSGASAPATDKTASLTFSSFKADHRAQPGNRQFEERGLAPRITASRGSVYRRNEFPLARCRDRRDACPGCGVAIRTRTTCDPAYTHTLGFLAARARNMTAVLELVDVDEPRDEESSIQSGFSRSSAEFFDASEELGRSPVPAVVLEVPTERIVAASPSGSLVLDPDGGVVIGRNFEDFTTDAPSGVLDLFAAGRVTGYETTRLLRRTGQDSLPVSVWLHKFDHQPSSRFALAVLAAPIPIGDEIAAPAEVEPTVVGTTDAGMRIDRVSNDTATLFGVPRSTILGCPLIDLVVEHDQADLIAAVTAAATHNRAVTLYVHAAAAGTGEAAGDADAGRACQLVILPMEPPASCAFVFLRVHDAEGALPTNGPRLSGLLLRLRRGSQVAGLARHLSSLNDRDVAGLGELTTREWEIVAHLLDGDRVPAIAAELFLSQSTVRSHLALVFGKLGVSSQQELLDVLRGKRANEV